MASGSRWASPASDLVERTRPASRRTRQLSLTSGASDRKIRRPISLLVRLLLQRPVSPAVLRGHMQPPGPWTRRGVSRRDILRGASAGIAATSAVHLLPAVAFAQE